MISMAAMVAMVADLSLYYQRVAALPLCFAILLAAFTVSNGRPYTFGNTITIIQSVIPTVSHTQIKAYIYKTKA